MHLKTGINNMKHILILVLLTTIYSCTQKESYLLIEDDQVICAIWKRTDIKPTNPDEDPREMTKRFPKGKYKNYFVNIFPDGKGSNIYSTQIDTFDWKIKNDKRPDSDVVDSYVSMSYENSQLRLLTLKGDTCLEITIHNGLTKMYFKKHADITANYLEDPFHPINNQWRIPASGKISDAEVRAKVNNYLMHYKYLFKAAVDSDNKMNFSNRNSLGVLKVYKSAIGIVPENKISRDWYSYFDGKNEALFAYDILKEMINSKGNKIKKSDDWIADNYKIINKMINNNN